MPVFVLLRRKAFACGADSHLAGSHSPLVRRMVMFFLNVCPSTILAAWAVRAFRVSDDGEEASFGRVSGDE